MFLTDTEYAKAKDLYNIAINYNSSETQAIELKNSLLKQGVSCCVVKADISKEDTLCEFDRYAYYTRAAKKDLDNNLNVCPNCDYHFRINARTRIAQLFDEDSFEEVPEEIYNELNECYKQIYNNNYEFP